MYIASIVLPRSLSNVTEDVVFRVHMNASNSLSVEHKQDGTSISTSTYPLNEFHMWLDTLLYMLQEDDEPFKHIQFDVAGLPSIIVNIPTIMLEVTYKRIRQAIDFRVSHTQRVLGCIPETVTGINQTVQNETCWAGCDCAYSDVEDGTVPDHEAHPKEYADAISVHSSDSDIYADMPPLIHLIDDSDSDSSY